MKRQAKILVVGIGSPHGDDTAAWNLVDQLRTDLETHAHLRKASSPHDLLDWLADTTRLHVVDACQSDTAVCCYDLSDGMGGANRSVPVRMHRSQNDASTCTGTVPKTRSLCTHQFDLVQTLELADALGQLPDTVLLSTLASEDFAPGSDLSARSTHSIALAKMLLLAEFGV